MRILISNDDGYLSPGIEALANAMRDFGEVTVVAPDRDRSGASNSLTLDRPLTVRTAANGFIYINGTPTDCVHVALTGLLDSLPDIVVSGINLGSNMGDDTIYSGTVAAATEGYLFGLPSFAISLTGHRGQHIQTAAAVAHEVVSRYLSQAENDKQAVLKPPFLLNVNVPDVPLAALTGWEITRLGKRHHAEPVVKTTNPRGDTIYWVGPAGSARDAGEGTDFHAILQQRVSITPLQMDLTRNELIPRLQTWLTADPSQA
ncbi:5'/3'-nucleotidase SurE [Parvibium lacunae]|uniref:5'-nucleotidase SurE n=1 Tax=Parvibium lacunae TaxID=1888893 RepID=A0A368L8H9_9BURK|nr:5'/3'-nucleotidase SurE [Parvibium lacunae]RCS59539.1 5'/3'-nucleotidase SurE [Parvibium lacunae]